MDRNTIIGLVLIAAVVFTWSVFFAPSEDTAAQEKAKKEAVAKIEAAKEAAATSVNNGEVLPMGYTDSTWSLLSDSAKTAVLDAEKLKEHGDFSHLYEGEDKVIHVQTDKYELDLHAKGGVIGDFKLRDYKTHDSLMLPMQRKGDNNQFSLNFRQRANVKYPNVSTAELYFAADAQGDVTLTGDAQQTVVMKAKVDEGHFIEFAYTFKGDAYDYGLELRQKGMNRLIEQQAIEALWKLDIPKTEQAMELMRAKTSIFYQESGEIDNINPRSAMDEPLVPENKVDWFAFHSQFFSYTLMTASAEESFLRPKFFQFDPVGPDLTDPNSGDVVKNMQATFDLEIATMDEGKASYTVFAGPLDVDVLKKYDRNMIYQVEMGWWILKYINRYLIVPVFNLLENMTSNYGLIIFLLAVLIKLLTAPMTYMTYISTAKMRIVNQTPEVKALEEKYSGDATKLQQEKMAIYRQLGVSMFGGCWPMLLQYPFLVALFFFFPNSIELRQESFLWAHDLSTYDSIWNFGFSIPWYGDHVSLFTLLMTASVFAFTIVNQKMQSQMVANPVMKYFPYIMPIILLGFLNSYSAGLSWYYLVSNLLSISTTMVLKKVVDDNKLLEKMRAAAKAKSKDPNKKKGTLERWAEKQQARQRDIMEQRNAQQGGKPQGDKPRGSNYTPGKKRK